MSLYALGKTMVVVGFATSIIGGFVEAGGAVMVGLIVGFLGLTVCLSEAPLS